MIRHYANSVNNAENEAINSGGICLRLLTIGSPPTLRCSNDLRSYDSSPPKLTRQLLSCTH